MIPYLNFARLRRAGQQPLLLAVSSTDDPLPQRPVGLGRARARHLAVSSTDDPLPQLWSSRAGLIGKSLAVSSTGHALSQPPFRDIMAEAKRILAVPSTGHALSQLPRDV